MITCCSWPVETLEEVAVWHLALTGSPDDALSGGRLRHGLHHQALADGPRALLPRRVWTAVEAGQGPRG